MMSRNFSVRSMAVLIVFLAVITAPILPLSSAGANVASAGANSNVPKPYPARPSAAALKWADKELKRMSVDQKVGQLISVAVNATFLNQDSDAFGELKRQVEHNHVGGII